MKKSFQNSFPGVTLGIACLIGGALWWSSCVRIKSSRLGATQNPSCVVVGVPRIYPSYDPSKITTTEKALVVGSLMSTLVQVGNHNEIYSNLADRWTISKDKLTYTFFIKPSARFSDGTPILASDVVASLKRGLVFEPNHISLRTKIRGASNLRAISETFPGIVASGKHEVIIRLVKPEPFFLYYLAFMEMGIMPRADAQKGLGEIKFHVTSGPFYIHQNTSRQVTLIANPFFSNSRGDASSCVVIKGYKTPQTALAALENGKIQVLDYGAVLNKNFEAIPKNPKFRLTVGKSEATLFLILNTRRPLFHSQGARYWFENAIKRSRLLPFRDGGLFRLSYQFLSSDHVGYLPSSTISKIRKDWKQKSVRPKSRNISILYPAEFGKNYASLIKHELHKETRLNIKLVYATAKNGDQLLHQRRYDALVMITGMGEKVTDILMALHFDPCLRIYSFNCKKITKLVRKALASSNASVRRQVYLQVSRELLQNAFIVPIAVFRWPIYHSRALYFKQFNNYVSDAQLWNLSWKK